MKIRLLNDFINLKAGDIIEAVLSTSKNFAVIYTGPGDYEYSNISKENFEIVETKTNEKNNSLNFYSIKDLLGQDLLEIKFK